MRIAKLLAENVKRLKVVELELGAGITKFTGKNGQGKSSVLDSILYALGGVDVIPDEPIRRGQAQGLIKVVLAEGEESLLQVTRAFSSRGTELSIIDKSGRKQDSPQKFLYRLLGKISFDPLSFIRMKSADQVEQLKALVKLDVDPDALDAENKADYDTRRIVSREKAALASQLDAMREPPAGLPEKPIDITALVKELEDAGSQNTHIQAMRMEKTRHEQLAGQLTNESLLKMERAVTLRRQAEEMESESAQEMESALVHQEKWKAITVPEPIDTAELTERIKNASATNRELEAKTRRDAIAQQLKAKIEEEAAITARMSDRDDQKRRAIASAEMPIEGLSFEAGKVYYNGFPIDQASGAEQLRVSMSIAMAMNPTLKMLLIRDGSLLDEDSMKVLEEVVAENDYQVLMEMVDSSGDVGIVMEDGAVKSTPATRKKPPQQAELEEAGA